MPDERYDDKVFRARFRIIISDMMEIKAMPIATIGMATDGSRKLTLSVGKETDIDEVVGMLKHLLGDLESGRFIEVG